MTLGLLAVWFIASQRLVIFAAKFKFVICNSNTVLLVAADVVVCQAVTTGLFDAYCNFVHDST